MASGSGRRSGRIGGEVPTAMRKERRFEDIVSDDDDEELMPSFLQKGKQVEKGNIHLAPPRKPRSTLHEQVGEDGFIFSIAAKSTKSSIPGAKGPPPPPQQSTASRTIREKIAEAETPVIRRNQQKRANADGKSDEEHFRPSGTERRQPSDSVKRIRRTSRLKDGTPAYPHPSISDADLHNYCSGDLESEDRMRHVAGWILERRRKEIKSMLQNHSAEAYRGPLLAALKATLRDLNKGSVQTQRLSSREEQQANSSSSSDQINSKHANNGVPSKRKKLPVHPRNEANREKKIKLKEVVQGLKREEEAWEQEQKEIDEMKKEIEAEAEVEDYTSIDDIMKSLQEDTQWNVDEKKRLEMVQRALDIETSRVSKDLSRSTQDRLAGTEEDTRWKEVEFNADLLRSKTHTFAQLLSLSHKYISAVSARGANALKEMTQGSIQNQIHSLQSGLGSSTSSTISRESRDNLDQILSGIRTITEETSSDDEEITDRGHAVGDVSEGDILRAYAQMS